MRKNLQIIYLDDPYSKYKNNILNIWQIWQRQMTPGIDTFRQIQFGRLTIVNSKVIILSAVNVSIRS